MDALTYIIIIRELICVGSARSHLLVLGFGGCRDPQGQPLSCWRGLPFSYFQVIKPNRSRAHSYFWFSTCVMQNCGQWVFSLHVCGVSAWCYTRKVPLELLLLLYRTFGSATTELWLRYLSLKAMNEFLLCRAGFCSFFPLKYLQEKLYSFNTKVNVI